MSKTLPFARMSAMNAKMQSRGRYYSVIVPHPKGGSYAVESRAMLHGRDMTEAEGLALLKENHDAEDIYACYPSEERMRNVNEDMAILWLRDFDGERYQVPAFIEAHAPDAVEEHFAEIDEARAMRREIASPELSGRI